MAGKRSLGPDVCPPPLAKRVQGEHAVGVGGPAPAESKTVAQQLLRAVLDSLLVSKTAEDFPLRCWATVRRDVAPLLDGPYNTRDTLLLRAETAHGRSLGAVLLLAAAAASSCGLAHLTAERAAYDALRASKTRNWIGWAKKARRTSALLAATSLANWSTLRSIILFPAEPAEPCDPSRELVECFQDHEDAVSIATLDDDYLTYLTCDCCRVAFLKCSLRFYRCERCAFHLCAECEERRVNFK
jgi:hypothetical protein